MIFCIRFVVLIDHIQQIRNQSENYYIPQEPKNLRFSPVIIFNFYFAFLIYIIDNIITYSLYSLYYVTRTFANSSAVSLSRVSRDSGFSLSPFHFSFTVPLNIFKGTVSVISSGLQSGIR